jgi:hypothetical protein
MSEAEIYARMLQAFDALEDEGRWTVADDLKKAMDAYAEDYKDRTDEDLAEAAKKVVI